MAWTIEYTEAAKKQIRKLDKQVARWIVDFMDAHVMVAVDPRGTGKALKGPLGGLWRYRVGDCRIICEIQDGVMRVLVVQIAHRRDVYR